MTRCVGAVKQTRESGDNRAICLGTTALKYGSVQEETGLIPERTVLIAVVLFMLWAKYTKSVVHMVISFRASNQIFTLRTRLVSLGSKLPEALIEDYSSAY